jgi:hypothetical protein
MNLEQLMEMTGYLSSTNYSLARVVELENVLHKLAYWFDTDQEILDKMTAAERDDHIRQHKMILDVLF